MRSDLFLKAWRTFWLCGVCNRPFPQATLDLAPPPEQAILRRAYELGVAADQAAIQRAREELEKALEHESKGHHETPQSLPN